MVFPGVASGKLVDMLFPSVIPSGSGESMKPTAWILRLRGE